MSIDLTAIGQRIRERRKARGLTQTDLAGAEVTKSFISQVEKGLVAPSLESLAVITERLGVTVSWLLGEDQGAVINVDRPDGGTAAREQAAQIVAGAVRELEALVAELETGADASCQRCRRAVARARMALGRVYEATGENGNAAMEYRRAAEGLINN